MKHIDLRTLAKKHEDKLKKIKVALFDVDGVLTDGRVFYQGDEMGFNRFFHVRDGYGFRILSEAGIKVGVISGGDSKGLRQRLQHLGIDYMYLGSEDKRDAYIKIREEAKVADENISYIGDELFDIPLLKKCGFSATVKKASYEVKDVCDYICQEKGGHGAGREIVELIRYAQGFFPKIGELD